MFCPSCGQQQISEEMKFCSRCGFPLGLVSEILAYGGFLPQLNQLNESKTFLTRKNGVKIGIGLILSGILLTPIAGLLLSDTPFEFLIGLIALLTFLGGVVTIVASLIFFKSASQIYQPNSQQVNNFADANMSLPNHKTANALPPQQSQPIENYVAPNWRSTSELVQPPSITEGTTKLLTKEE